MKRLIAGLAFHLVVVCGVYAAPGTVTLTNLTMNPGGSYEFEFNSATATPGNGADFLNILQTLTVASGNTPNSVFTISVVSLNSQNAASPLSDFNATRAYNYTVATAGNPIVGFAPTKFALDTTRFQNGLQGGQFSILQSSDVHSLVLQFRPVSPAPLLITQLALDRTSMPGSARATLSWNAIVGLSYCIQKRADLASGMWVDDSPVYEATVTNPMATSFHTTPAPGRQFYRIIEVAP